MAEFLFPKIFQRQCKSSVMLATTKLYFSLERQNFNPTVSHSIDFHSRGFIHCNNQNNLETSSSNTKVIYNLK